MSIPKILTERPHLVGLCDQLNARITIRDLAVTDWSDERSIVWEYKHDTKGHENYGWVAGLKFRHSDYYGQDVMLFAGQPRVAYIISMKTKEILLTANEAGFNPHTSELLPDGTFIVGSSNDGRVSVYPPGKSEAAFTLQLAGSDGGADADARADAQAHARHCRRNCLGGQHDCGRRSGIYHREQHLHYRNDRRLCRGAA